MHRAVINYQSFVECSRNISWRAAEQGKERSTLGSTWHTFKSEAGRH